MTLTAEKLYALLPAVYRVRDEPSQHLKSLLAVIAEQIEVLQEDLDQRYDDHFIETCADWVVPYIGDLIAHRPLHGVAAAVRSPRAEVARTIAHRRRKGTAAMLEQLARDVSNWNAAVVEYFLRIATTQYMNHVRSGHVYAPDLRKWEPLERLGTPFDTVPHTIDVRHISKGAGSYNIPNIGIFLWPVAPHRLTDSTAVRVVEADARRYLFSPLGHSSALITNPDTEDDVMHVAEAINAPLRISRRVLNERLARYYGPDKSLLIKTAAVPGGALTSVDITTLKVCSLADTAAGAWAHMPETGVAVDPVLGRIAFAAADAPAKVAVTYHYGFGADLGGGEYEREASFDRAPDDAEDIAIISDSAAAIAGAVPEPLLRNRVVTIRTSARYAAPARLNAPAGRYLELRAAEGSRPVLELAKAQDPPRELTITGGDGAAVTLNGFLIIGGALRVANNVGNTLRSLRLQHCTLVPGLRLTPDGSPAQPGTPSLIVDLPGVVVEIDHCIVGAIRVARHSTVRITDSIIDANAKDAVAFSAANGDAGGTLDIRDSTVIGRVNTVHLTLASNTIFLAGPDGDKKAVYSERKQDACVRFSYVPEAAIVPRRFRCVPNARTGAGVRPIFNSLRYGQSEYGQLARSGPAAIRRGADDGGEMGAFHKVYAAQREANVRARVDEYLRFGLEAGVMFAADDGRGD